MAPLSPIPSSTVAAIYAAWEAEHKNWDSVGLSMSDLGHECDRALWYSHRWASEPESLSGSKLRLFETGNIYERRIIDELRNAKIHVIDFDVKTDKQIKLYAIGGHLRGKIDGLADGVPEAPKTRHVLEIKSHNDKSFNELVKKGVQNSKPAHYAQMQAYLNLTGITRALYLAVNKNNDQLHAERVRYDAQFCLQLFARLERVITQNVAPGRISEDPNSFLCMWCRHKAVCHREAFGRQHCRTCLNSTPIVDHNDTSAPWLCEKFGRTLSLDEQRAGCHAHLYLPDAVPGDQFDSGDDWVAYKMRDGSTWTDQEKKAPTEPDPTEDAPTDCVVCGATVHQHCHMSGAFQGCPRDLGRLQNKPPEQPAPEPITRYWYHPESDCLLTTTGDEQPGDPLCEELTAEEYTRATVYYAGLHTESKQ